jgi:cyclomaltodextrinase / maltogenic alpha-amylase / neopullulanase
MIYEALGDGGRLVVALSVGEQPVDLPAPRARRVLAGGADLSEAGTDHARLRLPAHGWVVLEG